MPDNGIDPLDGEPVYYTVDDLAYLTGRDRQVIRKLIRDGRVPSVQDPKDRRRRLVPDTAIPTIVRLRQEGVVWRESTLTRSDGTTVTIRIRRKKEPT
jgi:hypothetical protein